VREGVVVDVGDDVSVARGKTDIARGGEPLIRLVDQTNRIVLRNIRGIVRRAVIDYDYFVIRIIEGGQGVEALA
jgi:hypothetical protein